MPHAVAIAPNCGQSKKCSALQGFEKCRELHGRPYDGPTSCLPEPAGSSGLLCKQKFSGDVEGVIQSSMQFKHKGMPLA